MPSRVDNLIASAQDAIRDLRSYTDFRTQRSRIGVGKVQALCAIAAAIADLAAAIHLDHEEPL